MTAPVLYEVEDGLASLTLNRPDKLNALSPDLMAELRRRLAEIEADDAVRVVILTGAAAPFRRALTSVRRTESGRSTTFSPTSGASSSNRTSTPS